MKHVLALGGAQYWSKETANGEPPFKIKREPLVIMLYGL